MEGMGENLVSIGAPFSTKDCIIISLPNPPPKVGKAMCPLFSAHLELMGPVCIDNSLAPGTP